MKIGGGARRTACVLMGSTSPRRPSHGRACPCSSRDLSGLVALDALPALSWDSRDGGGTPRAKGMISIWSGWRLGPMTCSSYSCHTKRNFPTEKLLPLSRLRTASCAARILYRDIPRPAGCFTVGSRTPWCGSGTRAMLRARTWPFSPGLQLASTVLLQLDSSRNVPALVPRRR